MFSVCVVSVILSADTTAGGLFFFNPVLVCKVLRLSLKPRYATPGNASKDLPIAIILKQGFYRVAALPIPQLRGDGI